MGGATALGEQQNRAAVKANLAQWMVIGQSGLPGKNALVPVVRVTGLECAPVVTLMPNMGAEPVRAKQWRPSCVI